MTHNLGGDKEPDIIAGNSAGTRTVWVARSEDDGHTWAAPRDVTASVKHEDWTWYATGPGVGIQLRREPYEGRLLIPCDHIEDGTVGCLYERGAGQPYERLTFARFDLAWLTEA